MGNMLRLARQPRTARRREDDRVLQAASLAFDALDLRIWCTLLNGAELVIAPRDVVRDPEALARFIASRASRSLG